jgi:hypothetical protein
VTPDLERDPRSVGLADVDGLAVADVDRRHPLPVEEDPVDRVVVDRDPAAVVEAQQQVRPRDQRVRHPQVGAQVAADDHVAPRREITFGSLGPHRQHWLRGLTHQCVRRFLDLPRRPDECPLSRIFHHTIAL